MTSPDGLTYRQNLIIAITTLVLVLAYVSYGLRLYARRVSGAKVWWDDYIVGAGLFFATIPCVSNYVGLRFGFGLHADTLPKDGPEKYLVCLFTLLLTWMVSSTLIKIGILLFYWRLFPSKHFRWSIWGVGAFCIACFIAGFVGFVLQCFPVNGFWMPTSSTHCLNRNELYLATATLGLIGDVILLIQPIPIVWRLKVDRSRRIGIILVFLLGGFVCIISIARLSALKDINPKDITYSNVGPGLWSTAEVTIGVVCANLPSMRPLFTKVTDQAARLRTIYHQHGRTESANTGSSGRHTLRSKGFTRMNDSGSARKNVDTAGLGSGNGHGLTSVVRQGRSDSEEFDFELGLPLHGIAVRTYVEQRVEEVDQGPRRAVDADQKMASVAPWVEPVDEGR